MKVSRGWKNNKQTINKTRSGYTNRYIKKQTKISKSKQTTNKKIRMEEENRLTKRKIKERTA